MKILRTLLNVESVTVIMLVMMLIRDHWHITGKYRDSAYRDCDINLKLNHKIHVVFHNLNNYDSPNSILK